MATTPDPFAELADEAAAADAARERMQTRWLRQQAAEEATLAGALLDLAESGVEVAVRSTSGRVHRGRVTNVGDDFVAVGDTWIRLAALVTVRPSERRHALAARAAPAHVTRFGEALAAVAPERPVIVAGTVTGDALRGTLTAVGVDVLTLALAGDDRAAPCIVALTALADVTVVV